MFRNLAISRSAFVTNKICRPAYSPDLNPIEQAFAVLKAVLLKAIEIQYFAHPTGPGA